jgi:predicted RNA-binding protein YlxR (DUF448 family)
VGCRKRDARDVLLRVVLAGEPVRAVPDVSRRAGGRGVSVHARRACLDAALKSGALARGLRRDPGVTAEELATWAAGQYVRRVSALLSSALRAGRAVVGSERVRDAIDARRVCLLIVASDAGEGQQGLRAAQERLGKRCLVLGDRSSLGKLAGRELVAVMALMDERLADEVREAARCADELGGALSGAETNAAH